MKPIHQQKGIGLIEIIVSLAIIAIIFLFFLGLAQYNLKLQKHSETKIEAINLTSEAMEAIRSLRDQDWTNISSLFPSARYYPIVSGNNWTLSSSDPGQIRGLYSRWIILENVYRDANDDIAGSGTEDDNTKKITATVEWTVQGTTKQYTLTTYLTNWRE